MLFRGGRSCIATVKKVHMFVKLKLVAVEHILVCMEITELNKQDNFRQLMVRFVDPAYCIQVAQLIILCHTHFNTRKLSLLL